MKKVKVGYFSLVKGSWINDRLAGQRTDALKMLNSLDIELVDCGDLIQNEAQAAEAIEKFADAGVDCLVVHFLTFALGACAPSAAKKLGVPVIFWSVPEPPMQGGRLQANSFCATNMNAHALWRMRLNYSFVYGDHNAVKEKLMEKFLVVRAIRELGKLRIGSVGGRVPGFYTSNYDELALCAKFGVETEKITLLEVVDRAKKILEGPADPVCEAADKVCIKDITGEEHRRLKALYQALTETAVKYRLSAFALRCWPDVNDIYGLGICGLIGMLNETGYITACEGDVLGAVAMKLGEWLTDGAIPFFCDWIYFDEKENTGVVWHCGAAAPSLCRGGCTPQFCKSSIIDGGGVKGVTCEFPLKPGRITMMRLGETREQGKYRLFVASGTALDTDQILRGNPLKVKFDRQVSEMVDTVIGNGIEHHYVVVHGDIADKLKLFAGWMDIEVL
ncbi:MAG: L-fucose/L-arabinose isomerase family protein [Victivallales bacterium]